MPMKHNISEEERQRRQRKYTNMLVILVIMIVISIVSFLQGENAVGFDWTETRVQVTDPGGAVYAIAYEDITELELMEHPNYGNCITGGETVSWLYGSWENEIWGQYTLCSSTAPSLCIVMHTAEQVYVLSYESNDITSALYDSICQFLENAN